MLCPICDTVCPEESNFCLKCGTSLIENTNKKNEELNQLSRDNSSETMTQALKRLMPTSYVEKLLATKGKMEGERRVVTILFSDIKGSTSMGEIFDPEEVLEIMNGAFKVLIEPVTRYEGTLARLMGDAILAFFGAPIAHEDDPYRACRAGLDILEGAKRYSEQLKKDKGIEGFSVRVGINTGLVVVAEVGSDYRVEYTAMGDDVNIAARMESSAEPGSVFITESTNNLVYNLFETEFIGPIKLKGKSKCINTYKLLRLNEKPGNIDQKRITEIIGRKKELITFQSFYNELHKGNSRILAVTGESGIGKSRLVNESLKFITEKSKWAKVNALTYTSKNEYYLIKGLVKNLLGYHQESLDPAVLKSLRTSIEQNYKKNGEEIFHLLEYFIFPSVNKDFEFADAYTLKRKTHYAIKEWLKSESSIQPLILICDDLQWCDEASLDLLNELMTLTKEFPLRIVLSYRLEEEYISIWNFHHKMVDDLEIKLYLISLDALSDEECEMLIDRFLKSNYLSKKIIQKIIKKTEGNPSFIEETLRSLTEKDLLSSSKDTTGKDRLDSDFQVPNQLQATIMSRIDKLSLQEKLLIQAASAIGRVFTHRELSRIVKNEIEDLEFEEAIKGLQVKEFIFRHLPENLKKGQSILEKEYIFKQEMTQQVVYNSLLRSHRERLHQCIAEVLENSSQSKKEEFPDILAYHYEKGKLLNKAIYYYIQAADKAKTIFANKDAIYFYSKALACSEKESENRFNRAEIYESLSDIYFTISDYSLAIETYKESLNKYIESSSISRIYYKMGQVLEKWGKYDEAINHYNLALTEIKDSTDNGVRIKIYSGLGMAYYRMEDFERAKEFNTKALEILPPEENNLTSATVYNNLGIIYCKFKQMDEALHFYQRSFEIYEKTSNISGLAASANNLGYLYQLKNNNKKAIEYYEQSIKLYEKIEAYHGLAKTYDNLSQVYFLEGEKEMAMEYNLKAVTILGKISESGLQINSELWLQSGEW